MTTIFWISLGLSAARWAWTEFMRWRDKGVIEAQAETIKRQVELNRASSKMVSETLKVLSGEQQAKHELLARLEAIKEEV